jgi:hypothetical protein
MFRACRRSGRRARSEENSTGPRRLAHGPVPFCSARGKPLPRASTTDRARRRRRHVPKKPPRLPAACVPPLRCPSSLSLGWLVRLPSPPSRVASAARAAWTLASAAAGKSGGDAAAPIFCSRAPPARLQLSTDPSDPICCGWRRQLGWRRGPRSRRSPALAAASPPSCSTFFSLLLPASAGFSSYPSWCTLLQRHRILAIGNWFSRQLCCEAF